MKCGQISLLFAALWLAVAAALSEEAAFNAQFLNVSEEMMISGERFDGYEIIEHRVSHCILYSKEL